MTVKSILAEKGRDVHTLGPDATVGEAAAELARHKIGALVITGAGGRIAGILSERDVVRVVAENGGAALALPVSAAMTRSVKTCRENHTVHDVMETMTRGRFRHLPVETGGVLAGIISIGDVVKRRIREVENEAEQIKQYIATV